MNNTFMTGQTCGETLRRMDLYIDNQLAETESADLAKHIEGCPSCFGELELRRRVQTRLRSAVASSPAPFLHTKILASIRSEARKKDNKWMGLQRQFTAAAAMLVVCFMIGGIAYNLGHLRWTAESREAYVTGLLRRVSTTMGIGLGDHVHCTVQGKTPRTMPKPEEVVNELPAEYKNLLTSVTRHVPSTFRLFTAHTCRYHKRQFYHLAFKDGDKLISLIVAKRQTGEKFDAREVTASLAQSGLPVYTSGAQRFQIAGFETRDHLAYLISDLGKQQNTNLMLALAPAVSSYLAKLES